MSHESIMPSSVGALCTDFYINQNIALKLDLPTARETVLDMFDRVRKEIPSMSRFRRFDDEVALESHEEDSRYAWLALRQTSIRSGSVNPPELDDAYRLHRLVLEIAPYFLSISPLDVDHLELVFGFDLEARTNRNEIVFDALLADSPLSGLIDHQRESVLDAEPFIGFALSPSCDLQAFVEVKSRSRPREIASGNYESEPISVYLTVRRYGSMRSIDDFKTAFGELAGHIERLAEQRVIPHVVLPIREAIIANPG